MVAATVLLAQLVAADSFYASERLREFVAQASERNRTVPAGLTAYRAQVESEIAVVARRPDGPENTFSLEQVANEVRWRIPGNYEQHVVGYRSQQLGVSFSSLGFVRQPWTVPILYGNRLSILFGRDTSRAAARRRERLRQTAVHPLAVDRDAYYRFSGGDTLITMRVGGRELPIVRVVVEPRPDAPPRTVAFRGELDIDATRYHLVRMRGSFVRVNPPPPSLPGRLLGLGGLTAIAYVELENGEFEGKYWLPTLQRFEAQFAVAAATEGRSVFRILSRYREHIVNDTVIVATLDSLVAAPYRFTLATGDSLALYRTWRAEIGSTTSGVHADDFDDIAPDIWRTTGVARTDLRVQRFMDAFRVNRIEGIFTGWGVQHRFRDAFPGLTIRGDAGYAWSEGAVRGRVAAALDRRRWSVLLRAGRSLDLTNDFRSVLDSGSAVGALIGVDDYDYVDRRVAAFGARRQLGARGRLTLETGPAQDAAVVNHWTRGIFKTDSGFRDNRGVYVGRYWRTWSALALNPDVSGELMQTGIGALLTLEHARGDLRYTRVEGRAMMRKNVRRLTLAARADVGIVTGDSLPPQQLFEVGATQSLQGYGYKEFVGNRAAVVRTLAMVRLPALEQPVRLGRWMLPPLAPALAAGAQGAWTKLSSAGAIRANAALGVRFIGEMDPIAVPIARETDGIRSSINLGLRFFGGAVGVGAARALDRAAPWKLRVDFSQIL